MGLLLSTPISIARGVLNDTDATAYRYSDADLLMYANGALRALFTVRPQFLYTTVEHTCVAGTLQSLSFDSYSSLVSVDRIKNGAVLTKVDKAHFDRFDPDWATATAAAAQHWMPHLDDPVKFFVYPQALNTQVLICTAVRVPSTYAAGANTGLPENLAEPVADYVVAMAESRDDEHVVSQRATQFMNQFAARFGGAKG